MYDINSVQVPGDILCTNPGIPLCVSSFRAVWIYTDGKSWLTHGPSLYSTAHLSGHLLPTFHACTLCTLGNRIFHLPHECKLMQWWGNRGFNVIGVLCNPTTRNSGFCRQFVAFKGVSNGWFSVTTNSCLLDVWDNHPDWLIATCSLFSDSLSTADIVESTMSISRCILQTLSLLWLIVFGLLCSVC